MNWKYSIIFVILIIFTGGWILWWALQGGVEKSQLPETQKENIQPLEISLSELSGFNFKDKKNSIEIIKMDTEKYNDESLFEQQFTYNNKIYALITDPSDQGNDDGSTVYSLKKIDKNGDREDLKNYLGDTNSLAIRNPGRKLVIGFRGNLYLILFGRGMVYGNDFSVTIEVLGDDDIIKDVRVIELGKIIDSFDAPVSKLSFLIIKDSLYFKTLEDCLLETFSEQERFAKEICYTGYYFFGDNNKLIKSDIFGIEKVNFQHTYFYK